MKTDILVIGAGIFGQVMAATLRRAGADVLLIGDDRPYSGSKAAGCVIKPGWISSLNKAEFEKCLGQLDLLYGVDTLAFKMPLKASVTAYRVLPRLIMGGDKVNATVGSIERLGSGFVTTCSGEFGQEEVLCKTIVDCRGSWVRTTMLSCHPIFGSEFVGRYGVSFKSHDALTAPFITPWAPFKQIVGVQMEDQSWIGDGTSLAEASWSDERIHVSRVRCQKELKNHTVGHSSSLKATVGVRPVLKGLQTPCYLKEESPGYWVNTAGGKNGTIAAAWAALELLQRLV